MPSNDLEKCSAAHAATKLVGNHTPIMKTPRLLNLTIIATLSGAWGAQQRVIAKFNGGEVPSDAFDRNDDPRTVADKLRKLAARIEREFIK